MAADEKDKLVIGSRGSKLALWQAEFIRRRLLREHPGLEVEIRVIKTTGDRVQDTALSRIGGKGLFTKEIEDEMLGGGVDLAVHSLKDLPTELPAGLAADIIPERTHGADVLVSRDGAPFEQLPAESRVGTGSLRRRVQLMALRPGLVYRDLRGNVDTRLRKLDRGDYDAIVLSQAGLVRLELEERITQVFTPELMLQAPGQGALAVEYRENDGLVHALAGFLNHGQSAVEVGAERDFLHSLGGGCQVPIGAHAVLLEDGRVRVDGLIADLEGRGILRDSETGPPGERPGRALALRLLERGGREILEEVYRQERERG